MCRSESRRVGVGVRGWVKDTLIQLVHRACCIITHVVECAHLGKVLACLERKDEARAAYHRGHRPESEKFGHGGMADDLRLALIELNE